MKCYVFAVLPLVIRKTILSFDYPELELQNEIFKNYNINVRPVKDHSKPVIVTVGLTLRKVLHLDEIRQSFKTTVNVYLYWRDENLQWNKSEHRGIDNVVIPFNRNIWIPDLMVYNALENPGQLGMNNAYIRLDSNGEIFVWTQTNFETACEIKTKRYPYDLPVCDVIITKFMSSDKKLEIRPSEKYVDMNDYVEIAEWKIKDTFVKTKVDSINIAYFVDSDVPSANVINYTHIIYTLTLQRSCKLCFFNVILPVLILATLNFLTFFVPCESGEKLSYPIAMFLTLAVFLTIIMRSLPESIDGVSYLSSYITFQLAISALILLCAVISLQIHHKKKKALKKITYLLTKCHRRPGTQIKRCTDTSASAEDHHMETERCGTNSLSKETLPLDVLFDKLMFYFLGICEVFTTITYIVIIWN